MKTKGYQEYKSKSGNLRFRSILIVDRKAYHIATHDNKDCALLAHNKAKKLIESMNIEEVKQKIRSQTIPIVDFNKQKIRNIFKHRNKFYFRFMRNYVSYHSSGYDTQAEAYMAFINHKIERCYA